MAKKLAIELEFTTAEFNAIAASMSGLSPTDQELETWVNEALDEKLRSLGAYGDVPDAEPAPLAELAKLCNMPNDETLLPAVIEHVKETKRIAAKVQNWVQIQPENSGEFAGQNIFIVACTIAARRKAPPAPYSESNPPQENDLVRVPLDSGCYLGYVVYVFRPEKGACNIAFGDSVPGVNNVEYIDRDRLTLVYRPPQGD